MNNPYIVFGIIAFLIATIFFVMCWLSSEDAEYGVVAAILAIITLMFIIQGAKDWDTGYTIEHTSSSTNQVERVTGK